MKWKLPLASKRSFLRTWIFHYNQEEINRSWYSHSRNLNEKLRNHDNKGLKEKICIFPQSRNFYPTFVQKPPFFPSTYFSNKVIFDPKTQKGIVNWMWNSYQSYFCIWNIKSSTFWTVSPTKSPCRAHTCGKYIWQVWGMQKILLLKYWTFDI